MHSAEKVDAVESWTRPDRLSSPFGLVDLGWSWMSALDAQQQEILLTEYQEVCKRHSGITYFRA